MEKFIPLGTVEGAILITVVLKACNNLKFFDILFLLAAAPFATYYCTLSKIYIYICVCVCMCVSSSLSRSLLCSSLTK